MKLFFWTRVHQISPQDAKTLIEQEEVILIDVRKSKDFEISHVEGALLADKKQVHEILDPANKSKPVICYCYMGISSRVACKNLTKAGFTNVLNLKGGYNAWEKTWPTQSK